MTHSNFAAKAAYDQFQALLLLVKGIGGGCNLPGREIMSHAGTALQDIAPVIICDILNGEGKYHYYTIGQARDLLIVRKDKNVEHLNYTILHPYGANSNYFWAQHLDKWGNPGYGYYVEDLSKDQVDEVKAVAEKGLLGYNAMQTIMYIVEFRNSGNLPTHEAYVCEDHSE